MYLIIYELTNITDSFGCEIIQFLRRGRGYPIIETIICSSCDNSLFNTVPNLILSSIPFIVFICYYCSSFLIAVKQHHNKNVRDSLLKFGVPFVCFFHLFINFI